MKPLQIFLKVSNIKILEISNKQNAFRQCSAETCEETYSFKLIDGMF